MIKKYDVLAAIGRLYVVGNSFKCRFYLRKLEKLVIKDDQSGKSAVLVGKIAGEVLKKKRYVIECFDYVQILIKGVIGQDTEYPEYPECSDTEETEENEE